jgi:hypothetical protein
LYALTEISGAASLPVYLEQLDKGKHKSTAFHGVIKFGDENAIPGIIKRIKQLVAKNRTLNNRFSEDDNDATDLIIGMEFLKKYPGKPEIKVLYEYLLTKKYDFLWESEKKWLNQNKLNF